MKDPERKEALISEIQKMEQEYYTSCHLKENIARLMDLRYRIKQAHEKLRQLNFAQRR